MRVRVLRESADPLYAVRFYDAEDDLEVIEEYYYYNLKDARYHFGLFVEDVDNGEDYSDMYSRITIEDADTGKVLDSLIIV